MRAGTTITHAALLIALLSGCDSISKLTNSGDDKPKLEGERVAILTQEAGLKPDSTVDAKSYILPDAIANGAWPQEGGDAESSGGNFGFSGKYGSAGSARVGKGNSFDTIIISAPVVAENKLFAMDAKGYTSAHDSQDVDKVLWVSDAIVGKDEPDILGGGLAYDGGKLFVSAGNGYVAALNASDGKLLWKQQMGVPMRSGPKVDDGKLYTVTVDNQLFAIRVETGEMVWSHRGISENAGFLTAVSPSVTSGVAIAPYSSGELVAINTEGGQERWTDTLALARKTTASSIFTGIDATPAISSGRVFAIGSGGLMTATDIESGRRVWEQPISGHNTPWVSGQFVYVVTSENTLAAISGIDGRVIWTSQVGTDEDRKKRVLLSGPVMVGGELVVVSAAGKMFAFTPRTGALLGEYDIPDGVCATPIVAQGTLYMVDKSATVHAFR